MTNIRLLQNRSSLSSSFERWKGKAQGLTKRTSGVYIFWIVQLNTSQHCHICPLAHPNESRELVIKFILFCGNVKLFCSMFQENEWTALKTAWNFTVLKWLLKGIHSKRAISALSDRIALKPHWPSDRVASSPELVIIMGYYAQLVKPQSSGSKFVSHQHNRRGSPIGPFSALNTAADQPGWDYARRSDRDS